MARIRSVKPEMRTNLSMAAWPREVRYAWVLLKGYLDDYGRGIDDMRLVVADLFPLDRDVTEKRIDKWLGIMTESSFLCRYEYAGQGYLHALNWDDEERISHRTRSRIPPCPVHEKDGTDSGPAPVAPRNDSGNDPDLFGASRTRAEQGNKGTREQGNLGASGTSSGTAGRGPRPKDEIWDALMASCGIETEAITDAARSAYNKAVKELRSVQATPAQITLRARKFQQQWPGVSLTPTALARRWSELNGSSRDPSHRMVEQ